MVLIGIFAGIWQLQLMLFKIALLHGIEIHVNVEFVKLLEPPEDQENQSMFVSVSLFSIQISC